MSEDRAGRLIREVAARAEAEREQQRQRLEEVRAASECLARFKARARDAARDLQSGGLFLLREECDALAEALRVAREVLLGEMFYLKALEADEEA